MARRRSGGTAIGGFFLVAIVLIAALGYGGFSIVDVGRSPSGLQEDAAAARARADVSSTNATLDASVRQTEVAIYNEQRVVEVTRQAAEIAATQTATAGQTQATANAEANAAQATASAAQRAAEGTRRSQDAVATMDSRDATVTAVAQAQVVADISVQATQQALRILAEEEARAASLAGLWLLGLAIIIVLCVIAFVGFGRIMWVLHQRVCDTEDDVRGLQRTLAIQSRRVTRLLQERE